MAELSAARPTNPGSIARLSSRDGQSRQLQAQKMEAIGRLAGGIAHDFNNLLTSIISFTRLVRDDLAQGDPRRQDLTEVLKAADCASILTRQLLAFSRPRPSDPIVVEVGECLRNIERILRRTLGPTVRLSLRLFGEPVSVRLDPGRFEQLIFNLAVNARDAMAGTGTLTIEVAAELTEDEPCAREYVRIEVSDTGSGMSADTMSRIFEPFFSTKGEEGTGLGLSTCYGIVRQAGGELRVTSVPSVGSTFTVLLPRVADLDSCRSVRTTDGNLNAEVTVLVVEDQPSILRVMTRALSASGVTVFPAQSGEEALAIAAAQGDGLDALVTDIALPGMSGVELMRTLRALHPKLKVLLTSGYISDEPDETDLRETARTAFLPKPFASSDLVSQLTRLLAEPKDALDPSP